MKNRVKGLFIVALILTSIVSSSFAFNEQSNMNSTSSSYDDGVLADTSNFVYDLSKTGSLVDILDSNPCDNEVTIYDFSNINNEKLLSILNENIEKQAINNSNLSDIELVKFDVKPVNSEYFNVSIDENNITKVTQLQRVNDNEQVIFLIVNMEVRNKSTGEINSVDYIHFVADKNPHIPNADKKVVNPLIKLKLSQGFCTWACGIMAAVCGNWAQEMEVCSTLGVESDIICGAIIAAACGATAVGCQTACGWIPGPF